MEQIMPIRMIKCQEAHRLAHEALQESISCVFGPTNTLFRFAPLVKTIETERHMVTDAPSERL